MDKIKSIQEMDIKNKRVLIRVDYNVPMDEQGKITDDIRVSKSLDTIHYCTKQNARVILMSHLGRPKGAPDAKFSLKPVAQHLSGLLGKQVLMLPDCVGPEVESKVAAMKPGDVAMLENLRFHKEEEKNDPEFSRKLAALGDVYVDDAFGAAHRAHASVVGVTEFLPSAAGFLLAKEVEYLGKAISNPDRPFVTILGGAKVSDKVKLISNLIDKADTLLIGGAMAYTFYKLMGIKIGNSKFEPDGVPFAEEALKKAKQKNFPMHFPSDRVIAPGIDRASEAKVTESDIPDGWSGFDIGPKTVESYKQILSKAKTIVWNGPVGLFEVKPFDKGTLELAKFIAGLKATKIIGGGDTAAAVRQFGLDDKMSHVSTGGGASLEFLEGTVLPGIAVLQEKKLAGKR
ncbi:MAG TPA: phosphoglycerate kinase [Verrucomicrobiae bacterium]|jgi:3-phosphoglycerate kinase|nr:phosphoglycerate kinase [Verrucomicrobiae bacterium]